MVSGVFCKKSGRVTDGSAVFFRRERLALLNKEQLRIPGNIMTALFCRFAVGAGTLVVCTTHLKAEDTAQALEALKPAEVMLEEHTNKGKDVDRSMIIVVLYKLAC